MSSRSTTSALWRHGLPSALIFLTSVMCKLSAPADGHVRLVEPALLIGGVFPPPPAFALLLIGQDGTRARLAADAHEAALATRCRVRRCCGCSPTSAALQCASGFTLTRACSGVENAASRSTTAMVTRVARLWSLPAR